jgi:hypothetical protein
MALGVFLYSAAAGKSRGKTCFTPDKTERPRYKHFWAILTNKICAATDHVAARGTSTAKAWDYGAEP